MTILIAIGVFISLVLLIEGAYLAFRVIYNPLLKKTQARLKRLSVGESIDILRKRELSEVPWLNRVLMGISRLQNLDRVLKQADIRYPVGFFVLFSLLVAFVGFWVGTRLATDYLTAMILGVISGTLPFLYISRRKRKRMQRFQEQLPDALEMMARALKAGHAFSGGLKMVADEFDDPVGTEFDKVVNEINYGIALPEAMKNLTDRVDCPDLRYFVTSVLVQRETGGNLTEILEKIAYLIRERFKLAGKIRVLAAEGKFSAYILIALPFFIAGAVFVLNPGYLKPLFMDPMGKKLVGLAIVMMIIGMITISKLTKIKV